MSYKEGKAVVTAIQRYCLDDGPGIRTAVFLKGCPLRCQWCHNPETHRTTPECMQREDRCTGCGACIRVCPVGARSIVWEDIPHVVVDRSLCEACGKCEQVCPSGACDICGKEMSVSEVMAEVERDRIFYESSGGGMTVTGGECAASPDFTLALLREAKNKGIASAIETSGYGSSEFFREAALLGTLFLYDLKEMDSDTHQRMTGVGVEKIHANLQMLMDMGAEIILRIPLIPEVNDSEKELSALADFLVTHGGRYQYAQIMPYHELGVGKAMALGKEPFVAKKPDTKCRKRWVEAFAAKGIDILCE